MEWIAFAASAVTALLSFFGVYLSNKKQTALMAYRLEQLEKKQDKHNQLIERTYALEEKTGLLEERVKVANHRIDDLEKKG